MQCCTANQLLDSCNWPAARNASTAMFSNFNVPGLHQHCVSVANSCCCMLCFLRHLPTFYIYADAAKLQLEHSVKLDDVTEPEAYEAIFLPGGHGPVYDLAKSEKLGELLTKAYAAGEGVSCACAQRTALSSVHSLDAWSSPSPPDCLARAPQVIAQCVNCTSLTLQCMTVVFTWCQCAVGKVVCAVCHGPAGLVTAKDGDKPLVAGKKVTGFSNSEERAVGKDKYVPFLLEDKVMGCARSTWTIHDVLLWCDTEHRAA